jgi:hypothetical protein
MKNGEKGAEETLNLISEKLMEEDGLFTVFTINVGTI